MKTIIIIPCYNEYGRLKVDEFCRFIKENKGVEFVFVNDGSTDNTLINLELILKEHSNRVNILSNAKNEGKGEAVRKGMKYAITLRPDFLGFWDADLATPLSAIWDLLLVFEQHPEIKWVFGSRVKILGRRIIRKEIRHYVGRVFSTLASTILKLPIYDSQCGAKIFRNDYCLELALQDKFISRWIFDVELIARLSKLSFECGSPKNIIYEFPLNSWEDKTGTKIKIRDLFIVPRDLFKIWLFIRRQNTTY